MCNNFEHSLGTSLYMKDLTKLNAHGSVHRNINLKERTNKMQPYSRIYYSNV